MSSNDNTNQFDSNPVRVLITKEHQLTSMASVTPAVSVSGSSSSAAGDGSSALGIQESSDMAVLSKSLAETLRELNQMNTKLLEMKGKLREIRVAAAEEMLELSLLHKPRQREVLAEAYQVTSSTASAISQQNNEVNEQLQSLHSKMEDQLSSVQRKAEESMQMCPQESSGEEHQFVPTCEDEGQLVEGGIASDDGTSVRHVNLNVLSEARSNTSSSVVDSNSSFVNKGVDDRMRESFIDKEGLNTDGKNAQIKRDLIENFQSTDIVAEETNELALHDMRSQVISQLSICHEGSSEDRNNNLFVNSPGTEKLLAPVSQEAICRADVEDITYQESEFCEAVCEPLSCPTATDHVLKTSDEVDLPNLCVNSAISQFDQSTNDVSTPESIICSSRAETAVGSNTNQDLTQVIGHQEPESGFDCSEESLTQGQRVSKDLIAVAASKIVQSDPQGSLDSLTDDGCRLGIKTTDVTNINGSSQQNHVASEMEISYSLPQEVTESDATLKATALTGGTALNSCFSAEKNEESLLDANLEAFVGDNDYNMNVTCADSTRSVSAVNSQFKLSDSDRVFDGEQLHYEEASEREANPSEHPTLANDAESQAAEPPDDPVTFPLCVSDEPGHAFLQCSDSVQPMDIND